MIKTCSKCVMDTTDRNIFFNQDGVCQYCVDPWNPAPITSQQEQENLDKIAAKLKAQRQGKYDCLVGISGGVDSCYVAHLAKRMGLNALIMHCDNGWNSSEAVRNINNIVEKTGFDYEALVLDWQEFKDLQRAFFKASVMDIEVVTDHAIFASLYKIARKHRIRHVLVGTNYATERTPASWVWRKNDRKNLLGIHNAFGERKIKSFPLMGPVKKALYDKTFMGPDPILILNEVNYKKKEVMALLQQEYNWKYYGGKHHESVFTKFFQAYYLPHKFNIDKRKAHLSVLIRNGEISREFALKELEKDVYQADELKRDFAYVAQKLDFTVDEFTDIINNAAIDHAHYGTDNGTHLLIRKLFG